jgi:ABC-type amino acid transport substrate-binding protein
VGFIDFPPHITLDEEYKDSPLYQYINTVFIQAGLKVVYVKLPRERAFTELITGRVDVLMPTSIPSNHKTVRTLSFPLFHTVPGLCFKKENYIPILSATHRFEKLNIGVPAGSQLVAALTGSRANLIPLKGDDVTSRGVELTQRGRLDAFYHPSPVKVYHQENPLYKEVACSYFHGYSTSIYIAIAKTVSKNTYTLINKAFHNAMLKQPYEYYFALRK